SGRPHGNEDQFVAPVPLDQWRVERRLDEPAPRGRHCLPAGRHEVHANSAAVLVRELASDPAEDRWRTAQQVRTKALDLIEHLLLRRPPVDPELRMNPEAFVEVSAAFALERFRAEVVDLDAPHGGPEPELARGPEPKRQQQPLLDGGPPDRQRSARRTARAD